MFAKFVGRRATALATSLAVVIGLAITPAFTATAAEGDEPVVVETPFAELVEAPVEAAPLAAAPLVEHLPAEVPAAEELPTEELPVEQPELSAPLSVRSASPLGASALAAPVGMSPATIPNLALGESIDIQFSTTIPHDYLFIEHLAGTFYGPSFTDGRLTGSFLLPGTISLRVAAFSYATFSIVDSRDYTFTVSPAVTTTSLPDAIVGTGYNQTLNTTRSVFPSYETFTIVEGTLPSGLSLNRNTGQITGTVTAIPANPTTYSFSVSFTMGIPFFASFDSAPQPLSITVGYPAPVITTATLPAATVGSEYVAPALAADSEGTITWSATGLPTGLVLDAATGVISGTPDYNPAYGVTATVPVTVTANNGRDSAPQALLLTVNTPAPVFGAQRLPAATVGVLYDQPLPVSNAYGDLSYALVGARSLPSGLQLTADGRILGTPDYDPTAGASKAVTIRVQVSGTAGSDEQAFRFNLRTPAPEITTTTLPDGWWKQPYNQPVAATGPGVVLAVTGLPANLHFDGTTITGKTRILGTFELQVTAINTAGVDVEKVYLTINDKPTLYRMPVVKMQTGDTFTGFPQFSGEDAVLTLGSDAPAGMKLNQNNRIKWTPTAPGVYKFTITATNPAGTDTQEYTFKVFDAPVITQGALDQGITTVNYRQELQHDGTNVRFTVVKGDLPDGITLSRTGVLEGAPTEAGTFQFRVKAQNPVGVDRQWFTITVTEPAMTLSSSSVIRGGSLTVSGTGYLPGDTLELWLHSTPVLLGTVTATGGTFTSTVKIPANTPAGQHHLVVVGTQSGSQSVPLSIGLPAALAQQPRSTTQPQSPQLTVTPSVETTTIDESDDSEVEEIVDEAEEELPTLNKPEAAEEAAAPALANWSGLLLAALVLLIAALLVAFLLWRRRMASGS